MNLEGQPRYRPETFLSKMQELQDNRVFYDHPRDTYRQVMGAWNYEKPLPPLAHYVENIYDGIKLVADRLFDPMKNYLTSNELKLGNRYWNRPWHY